jgi:hypothetical protein
MSRGTDRNDGVATWCQREGWSSPLGGWNGSIDGVNSLYFEILGLNAMLKNLYGGVQTEYAFFHGREVTSL